MIRKLAVFPLALMATSCSMRMFYPTLGAVAGGTGGAIMGGIPGAAIGSGAGAAVGQIAKGEGDVQAAKEETQEVIKAVSEGDVKRLLEIQAKQEKGAFDNVIDGIYTTLWILGIAAAVWFVLPVVWAKWHVSKTVKKHVENINGKTKNSD